MTDQPFDRRGFMASAGLVSVGTALAFTPAQAQRPPLAPTPRRPVQLPDPTKRQGQYVEVNGARIFYQMTGNGPPMLLIHGYPLSGALFSRVRDDLSRRFRLVTLDLRGYGNSSAPGVPDTIATYADDVLALMQHLKLERAHIGGMSMGGPILFEMYKRAPERFAGIVLIDTIAAAANPAEKGLWMGVAEMARSGGIQAIVPVLMPEMLSGDTRMRQPELVKYLDQVMSQASRDALVGGAKALATRPDYTGLFDQIRVPTQILVGLDDTVYPIEIARNMNRKIARSRLDVVAGAAHAEIFEAPDRASTAILAFHGAA